MVHGLETSKARSSEDSTTPSAKALGHTAAFRAARRIAAEIHFREKHGVTSAENPDNAAFLDRRAAELAPIVQEEYANSHYQLLSAAKYALEALRAIQKHVLPQVAGQTRRFTEETSALEQAISQAESGVMGEGR